jgi:alcohol dehydrogenase class IV
MTIATYRGFAQTLITGSDAVDTLGSELRTLGAHRVALLSSPSVARGESFRRVHVQLAGCEIVETFTATRPHAPISDTEELADRLAGLAPDAIVALGGGSVSDTGKACAVLLAEKGHIEDHCSTFTPPDQLHQPILTQPKIPVIAIPTTLSGAEMTPGAGATNAANVKRVFWDHQVSARVAIFDPTVLRETPTELLVTTAMNGLAHCAEGLYSRAKNPVSSALAIRGAGLFARGLTVLAREGATDEALTCLGEAAALGGMVISHARVGLHHAVCHVLGAYLGLAHGTANAVMLPYVLAYNEPATVLEQRDLARAVHGGLEDGGAGGEVSDADGAPASAAAAVAQVERLAGAPSSLQEVGVRQQDLEAVAERTMADRGLFFNPRRVQAIDEVREILEQAWVGERVHA